ncbi:MAG: hypothetical protein K2Q20_00440, partial [Phycisphaerales bacterium]|nr:hypothetical protein [Phycisphaerales bacterium]
SMEARAQAIQAAATAHTQTLEERLKRATRELEQRIEAIRRDADSIVGPSADKLHGLCERAAEIMGTQTPGHVPETSLAGLVARAEGIAGRTEGAIDHMDRVRLQAEKEKAELDAWIARGHERLDEIQARWKQVDALSAELAGRSQTSVDELKGRLEQTAAVIRSTLDQAVMAAQTAGEGAVASIRLAGEQALGDTQRLLGELSDRMVLSRLESQQLAQQIDERTAGMRIEAQAALELVGPATSQAIEDFQAAERQARASVDSALLEIKPRTDASLGELREAVRQSHAAHNTTGLALKLLEKASANALGMLERLKPWEGVLTGDQERMPEPIARIIEGVRREVHGDLSNIASALRDAAGRAERAGSAIAYELVLLAAYPPIIDEGLFLLNRPAVALVLVGVANTTTLTG